jgi:hypothetical protein
MNISNCESRRILITLSYKVSTYVPIMRKEVAG